ncbi:MAG: type IV secretory system conjugative DNA transfer family protein [Eubacteriales bacterium]|nr:type IV secretory system conjugative DNA transfer family protein [Eubacteriales bacterium]
MGIIDHFKGMDMDFSSKCRQVDELKMECARSNRGTTAFSSLLSMSRDFDQTRRNNNMLVFDEKESNFDLVLDNLKDDNCNYVVVDFDGAYYQEMANDFAMRGFAVKKINLMDVENSDGYNPFSYTQDEIDVDILVQCIVANTNSSYYMRASIGERIIINNLEKTFLKILISCYMKYGTSKTMNAAVNLLSGEDREVKLDRLFSGMFPQGPNEMECNRYKVFKQEAGDRFSDIVSSCADRIEIFKEDRMIALAKKEPLQFEHLYLGKQVLFIMIPSNMRQAELLTSVILSQICNMLCNESRRNNKDRTVMMYFNYFADLGMVVDLERLISQFPHFNLGCMLHVNSFAKLGQIYKDWEVILEACDSMVYLGLNDDPTHQYVLEHADSVMIRKKRMMGKEMYVSAQLKIDEIRDMDANDCIAVVKGIGTFLTPRCGRWIDLDN